MSRVRKVFFGFLIPVNLRFFTSIPIRANGVGMLDFGTGFFIFVSVGVPSLDTLFARYNFFDNMRNLLIVRCAVRCGVDDPFS